MRRLVAAGLLALLALALGLLIAAGRTRGFDAGAHAVAARLASTRWLVAGAIGMTQLGKIGVRGPVAAVAALLLARAGRSRAATALVVAVAGGELLVQLIKVLVGRPRPPALDELVHAAGTSYPSGHAAGCMILYPVAGGLLWRARPATGAAVGVAFALLVGLTRVLLGVHWVSDVASGWLIGAVVALLATHAARRNDATRIGRRLG